MGKRSQFTASHTYSWASFRIGFESFTLRGFDRFGHARAAFVVVAELRRRWVEAGCVRDNLK